MDSDGVSTMGTHESIVCQHAYSELDDRPFARQKRKRTSPEDQAVLEAAFKCDTKPDKNARLELVNRVALTEKEVQIWFQNRRQSSRRKSRPLLPHEVAQYHLSRANSYTCATAASFGSETLVDDQNGHVEARGAYSGSPETSNPSEDSGSLQSDSAAQHHHPLPPSEQRAHLVHHSNTYPGMSADTTSRSCAPLSRTAPGPANLPPRTTESVGYLANRRSAPCFHGSFSAQPTLPPVLGDEGRRSLTKSASFVRLSMNAEGKAEVTTKDASSPSPPRPPQLLMLPDAPQHLDPTPQLPPTIALQRSSSGRSRDSRSWEFWCDKDARSELGTAAEKDAVGSAAGAIGLLRTASCRSILSSIPSKRNGTFTERRGSAKHSKQILGRSSSQPSNTLAGRLQKSSVQTDDLHKLKHSSSAVYEQLRGTDSDKENWAPARESDSDSQSEALGAADQPLQATRLHQSRSMLTSQCSKHGKIHPAGSREDRLDPEADAEVAAFMHGSQKGSVSSADDELDCVQGLLSLSQGNWR